MTRSTLFRVLPALVPSFSPGGAALAIKHGDVIGQNFVTLWDAGDGTSRGGLNVPAGGYGVELLRDGDTLITTGRTDSEDRSGSAIASAQLWDVATRQPIGEPLPLGADGGGYVFRDPDGTTAVIGTTDGVVVWDTDPAHWEALACAIAGRNLSATEWQRYLSGHPYRATCAQWPAAVG